MNNFVTPLLFVVVAIVNLYLAYRRRKVPGAN